MDASRTRLEVHRLIEEVRTLAEAFLDRSPLFPGSLYEQKSQCGKPDCKCARGPYRHRQWCLSFLEEGRSRTRVVPAAVRPAVADLAGRYREVRRARRRLVRLLAELVAKVDALGEGRCREGRRRYARLAAGVQGRAVRPKQGGPSQ
jgi:hypothetical protein